MFALNNNLLLMAMTEVCLDGTNLKEVLPKVLHGRRILTYNYVFKYLLLMVIAEVNLGKKIDMKVPSNFPGRSTMRF